jgi:hypothetical protein
MTKLAVFKKIFRLAKVINFNDTTCSLKLCDVLLFCHDVDRSVTLHNRAYSVLLDSIRVDLESSGLSCISIAHPWSRLTGREGYGSPVAMNRSYFFSLAIKKIFKAFGLNLNVNPYERIIGKAKPKIIITIGCNNALCEAARKLNVFHAELLHGIGYAFIPWGWDRKETRYLPQAIIALDTFSIDTFSALQKKGIVLKQIAHPFFNRFNGSNLNLLPAEWKLSSIKSRKEILVTLQWGHAPDIEGHDPSRVILPNGLFYTEIEEVVRRTRELIFWRFRFHPVQYRQKEKYRKLFDFMNDFVLRNDNCEWEESTYKPLPSLLLRCDGHITMNSKSSYEAAYFGVQTIALSPTLRANGLHANYFEDLVREKYLSKIEVDVNRIYMWALSVNKKEPMVKDLFCSDDFSTWILSRARSS